MGSIYEGPGDRAKSFQFVLLGGPAYCPGAWGNRTGFCAIGLVLLLKLYIITV